MTGPKRKLPVTEELDFHCLLTLMTPLKGHPDYEWLPELFSIIGHEKLLLLCKYCGGETIRIPEINELLKSLHSLQWFYDIYIKKEKSVNQLPDEYLSEVVKIKEIYSARDD